MVVLGAHCHTIYHLSFTVVAEDTTVGGNTIYGVASLIVFAWKPVH